MPGVPEYTALLKILALFLESHGYTGDAEIGVVRATGADVITFKLPHPGPASPIVVAQGLPPALQR